MANNPTTRLQQWARFLEAKAWLSSVALPGILGTVSQTAGAPTGAIIERGSNANGEYVRFADGTQICTTSGVTFTQSSISEMVYNWTFPTPFSVGPTCSIVYNSAGAAIANIAYSDLGAFRHGNSGNIGNLIITKNQSAVSFPANATVSSVRLSAIGRWF